MRSFPKPRVVVSKCLEFEACRYNGDVLKDMTVRRLMPYVEFIPICPEVEIGLGTPRETVRLVSQENEVRMIQPSTKQDLTEDMNTFSRAFFDSLPDVDGFILKNRSPSCGTRDVRIYTGVEKAPVKEKGTGLFGGNVLNEYGNLAIEEEGRLSNFTIREHFLTKLYTLTSFRILKGDPSIQKLIQFQSQNKYLFMAYNQTRMKKMGRIIANHKQYDSIDEVFAEYEQELHAMFQKAARYTSNINVCQHIMGYFSEELSKNERDHFLHLLERYKDRKIPLSNLLSILKSWVYRFDNEYLLQQSFFEPYPEDLVEMADSGKGRSYA
ncbi:YbgA family protein [Pseudalkalibacillus sp. Hm43]|uniref:YbgA family protein n=1 Tax=Pseudalkalibacillus sp. Hm43 TaxID=3450742 RepID=UPI003F41C7FE